MTCNSFYLLNTYVYHRKMVSVLYVLYIGHTHSRTKTEAMPCAFFKPLSVVPKIRDVEKVLLLLRFIISQPSNISVSVKY